MPITIGQAIKKAREAKGLSRNALAIKADIDPTLLFNWEHERNYPSIIPLISVADVLGVTLDELVGRNCK